jgi:hypothetical protein
MLTDLSYARQMVTLTYPHIGNTGMTDQDNEASKVWSAGLDRARCPAVPQQLAQPGVAAGLADPAWRGPSPASTPAS